MIQIFPMCKPLLHRAHLVSQVDFPRSRPWDKDSYASDSFFFFNWRLIILKYCGGFCHTLTWISHGCTCVPHPEPSSHLPPYPVPQGHPSAPALSTLSHASNLDWRSVSHMIIYMFQFYSLKSSHPHPLQKKKSVLYLCVSFAVSHIGSLLPSF